MMQKRSFLERHELALVLVAGAVPLVPCGNGGTSIAGTEVASSGAAPQESRQSYSAPVESSLEGLTIGGFVSTAWFYNLNRTDPLANAFVKKHDQFTLHKAKLQIEKPTSRDDGDWASGFRIDLITGEDAKVIHAAGLGDPDIPIDLEQAYFQVRAPIGRGLTFTIGKTATLMGFEVIEETQNPNYTVGNQFLYAENFTQLGGSISYELVKNVEVTFAVLNGWDRVVDNNDSPSYMLKTTFAPGSNTSLALLIYGGPERDSNDSDWRKGVEAILSARLHQNVSVCLQLDYGTEDGAALSGDDAEWAGIGSWIVFQTTKSIQLAFRADHFLDMGSSRTGFDPKGDASISSFTFTVNILPLKNLQIRPELRYDLCSEPVFADDTGLTDKQVLIGCGASYTF